MPKNLDEFLSTYDPDGNRVVLDLDLNKRAEEGESAFIIVRYNGNVLVLNPMRVDDYLDVDAHPFKDGKDATVAAFGMSSNLTRRAAFEHTGTTSQGWASTGMVALLVGEQKEA